MSCERIACESRAATPTLPERLLRLSSAPLFDTCTSQTSLLQLLPSAAPFIAAVALLFLSQPAPLRALPLRPPSFRADKAGDILEYASTAALHCCCCTAYCDCTVQSQLPPSLAAAHSPACLSISLARFSATTVLWYGSGGKLIGARDLEICF